MFVPPSQRARGHPARRAPCAVTHTGLVPPFHSQAPHANPYVTFAAASLVHSELEFHLNLTGGIPAYAFALLLGSSVREAASAPLGVDQRYRTITAALFGDFIGRLSRVQQQH